MKQAKQGPQLYATTPTRDLGSRETECTLLARGAERFERQGDLGSGGLGTVEHAFDLRLQRDVAIKTLHPGRHERVCADDLAREARIAARLEHPSIPPVYELLDAGDGSGPRLVMKLIQGQCLSERLSQGGAALDNLNVLRPLLEILVHVCDAAAFAHEQRVLHLDLKPANVMLESSGRVYVVDWGGALRSSPDQHGNLRPLEMHRRVFGTLTHMAPEQFEMGMPRVDQRTDVYGLGGILYQMLTGREPFEEDDLERASVNPPLAVPVIDLPHPTPLLIRLTALTMRALSPDKESRPPDVISFRRELVAVLREESFLSPRRFPAGTQIVRQDEEAHAAFLLLEGECRVCQRVGDADVQVGTITAGETFGESAMLANGRRTASVEAVTDVMLLAFGREEIEQRLGQGWLLTLVRNLVARANPPEPSRTPPR